MSLPADGEAALDDDGAGPRALAASVSVGAVAAPLALRDEELEDLRVLLMRPTLEIVVPFVGFVGFLVGAETLIIDIVPANVGSVILAIVVGCTATILPAHAWRERLFARRARELGLDDVGILAVRRAVRQSLARQRERGRTIVVEQVRDDIRAELARTLPAASSLLR